MAKKQKMGMKWFHFLIYFLLWVNAAGFILGGLGYIMGLTYESSAQVYAEYPQLQMVDVITGIVWILFGIFVIRTRTSLANFKKGGPARLNACFIVGDVIIPVAYNVISLFMIGAQSDILLFLTYPSTLSTIAIAFVMVAIHNAYFKKRATLFNGNEEDDD